MQCACNPLQKARSSPKESRPVNNSAAGKDHASTNSRKQHQSKRQKPATCLPCLTCDTFPDSQEEKHGTAQYKLKCILHDLLQSCGTLPPSQGNPNPRVRAVASVCECENTLMHKYTNCHTCRVDRRTWKHMRKAHKHS